MKKILFSTCLLLQILSATAHAAGDPFLFAQEVKPYILVNNRILSIANGKPISVYDVMKKMDVLFYKQYPQYSSNPMARFQFYKINWKNVLQDLIDKELIIADAKESKLPITSGEIRKEMELTFGPNIVVNLDKAGISFDEAWQIMEDDLIIRRMIGYRAHLKAFKRITPQVIRAAYDEFAQKNIRPEEWEYGVISIRDTDPILGAESANWVHQLVTSERGSYEDLEAKLKQSVIPNPSTKVSISELFRHDEATLSPAYKEGLLALTSNNFSAPIAQKSRKDDTTIYRIFYLKDRIAAGAPPFQEVEGKIRQQLLEEAIEEESSAYFEKLRKHYHVNENDFKELISSGFEPFVVK